MPNLKLTKRNIEAIPLPERIQEHYWDSEMPGFGLVVGQSGAKTFVLQKHNRRRKIGRFPAWTPEKARLYAAELIVSMDKHIDPYEEKKKKASQEVTFEKCLAEYVAKLKAKKASERTIDEMQKDLHRYLPDWLKRPIASITREDVRARHKRVTKNGPYAANGTFRYFRAIFNVAKKVFSVEAENPCIAIDWNKETRRREPIPWEELPAWAAMVEEQSPVLRDYLHVCLFTGMRSEDTATVRWDDVDFKNGTLHRPNPKGGVDKAFTVPLSEHVIEILKKRKKENAGHDDGWAFPTRNIRDEVVPIVRRRWGPGKSRTPHRLRDTYTTACAEAGLSPYDIDVLTNHTPPKGSVTAGYIRQSIPHLRKCQETVTAFLLSRLS